MFLSTLEEATREAIDAAVQALALHLKRDRGYQLFDAVKPKLPGWCEAHYRYAAIKEYVQKMLEKDEASDAQASNIIFSYRNGVSVDTPCALCGNVAIWGSCEMLISRPCGHAVCRSKHKQESKSRCLICRKKVTATFSRDNMYSPRHVIQSYYDGFIDKVLYNDWFRTHFYYKLN